MTTTCLPPSAAAGVVSGSERPRAIPPGCGVRVVGDVHGDAAAFAYASATDRFVLQLGDLTDHGPTAPARCASCSA